MSVLPSDLLDGEIVKLRSSCTASRKYLDDVKEEIDEQVQVIVQAKARDVAKPVLIRYTRVLETLLADGDKKLNIFTGETDALLQRLEMLILRLENTNPPEHARVVIVRNKLVGDAKPYKGFFRKMRVQHEELLSVLTEEENIAVVSAPAAPPVVSHSRKEFSFLKPAIINGDCTKRELKKFLDDTETWLNKTLTQSEREEPGMVLAVIKSVLDSDWADILDRTPDIKTKTYDEISEVM